MKEKRRWRDVIRTDTVVLRMPLVTWGDYRGIRGILKIKYRFVKCLNWILFDRGQWFGDSQRRCILCGRRSVKWHLNLAYNFSAVDHSSEIVEKEKKCFYRTVCSFGTSLSLSPSRCFRCCRILNHWPHLIYSAKHKVWGGRMSSRWEW